MDARDPPPGLVHQLRVGQVALFAGAGASVEAGLPTWSQLVDQLAHELGLSDASSDGRRLNLGQLTAIAQYYENRFGRKSLTEKLRDLIPRNGTAPSPSHRLLADLPCDLYYTTNFDGLLEASLEAGGREFEVVSSEEDARDHSGRDRCQVRKLHGSIDTAQSLVITRDDFLRYDARHQHLSERLRTDLATTTFLFCGYSLDDPDFSLIYDRAFLALAPFERRHYITVFDANDYQIEDLRRRGLEVINLETWNTAGNHDGLTNFLSSLCEATSDAMHIRRDAMHIRRLFSTVTRGVELPIVVPSYIHPVERYELLPRMDFQVGTSVDRAMSLLGVPTGICADIDVIDDDPERFMSRDVALVGSPRGNKMSEFVFDAQGHMLRERSGITVEFVKGDERQLILGDAHGRYVFSGTDPAQCDDDDEHYEYAVIARYRNPWAPLKSLWLMAGLWGLGTQALADLFVAGGYRKIPWPTDGDVASVLRITYTRTEVKQGPFRHRQMEVVRTVPGDRADSSSRPIAGSDR
jgi:hypothetical protein